MSTKRTSQYVRVLTDSTTPNGLRDECKAMHKRLLAYNVYCSKAKLQKSYTPYSQMADTREKTGP